MQKIHVALVFGGRSAEHEISLLSARNVMDAIDHEKYHVVPIAIDKEGHWFTRKKNGPEAPGPLKIEQFTLPVSIAFQGSHRLFTLEKGEQVPIPVDVFFPILHGPYGEDGTIQGLFRILQVPFVGCDVLGSAVGMDKDVMKRLLIQAGIPIGKFLVCFRDNVPSFADVVETVGLPFYVKPANMGSSVGISKVAESAQYGEAVHEAFKFDRKILFEENIDGLEIECAVLGNRQPEASAVGQIISYHSFYTYASKYLDDKGFKLEIPAKVDPAAAARIRKTAIDVFRALEAEGLGRVDVFLRADGSVVVNEINTMPGFTSISMYPMLWKESGISYIQLIDRLISLAFDRESDRESLQSDFSRNP